MCFSTIFQKNASQKLWEAIEKQDYRKVKALLESDEKLNINYYHNCLPILHIAVLRNNLPILQLIFSSKYGQEVNLENKGTLVKFNLNSYNQLIRNTETGNAFAFAKEYKYDQVYNFLKQQQMLRNQQSQQPGIEVKSHHPTTI